MNFRIKSWKLSRSKIIFSMNQSKDEIDGVVLYQDGKNPIGHNGITLSLKDMKMIMELYKLKKERNKK